MRTKLTPEQIAALDKKAHKLAAAWTPHTPVHVPEVNAPEPIKEKKVKVKPDPRRALRPDEVEEDDA